MQSLNVPWRPGGEFHTDPLPTSMRGSRSAAENAHAVCPWGKVDPRDLPLPTEAASVFVDLTYRAPSDGSSKKQISRLGMLRKGLKRLSTNPAASTPSPYGPAARLVRPLPSTPHRLNPIPPEVDNPYGIAYPARQAREQTVYPSPNYSAPPPKPPSGDAPLPPASVAESRRVAGGTTRSAFTGHTNLTGFTGFTGFSDYPSLSRTIDTTATARTGPSLHPDPSTGSAFGTEFNAVIEEQRSMGAVSRSTYAQSTSFGSTTQHVYVPSVSGTATGPAGEPGEGSSAGALSGSASGSAQRPAGPPSRSMNRSAGRDRFTIPEEETWSGGEELDNGQRVAAFASAPARPDALGGLGRGHAIAGVTTTELEARLREKVEAADTVAAAGERVEEVRKALENVKRLGMDQLVMRQFQYVAATLPGACTLLAPDPNKKTKKRRRHHRFQHVLLGCVPLRGPGVCKCRY